jgi:ribosome maturation factor RimP
VSSDARRAPDRSARTGQQHTEEAAVTSDAALDQLRSLLDPVVSECGFDLDHIEVSAVGRRRLVRVLIDSDDGVTLDDVGVATQAIARAMESSQVMGEASYTLEVSSRGIDRPLTLPRHWRRNVGRLVTVVRVDGSTITGRISRSDLAAATLDVDGDELSVDFADVKKAQIQVEFNKPPRRRSPKPRIAGRASDGEEDR